MCSLFCVSLHTTARTRPHAQPIHHVHTCTAHTHPHTHSCVHASCARRVRRAQHAVAAVVVAVTVTVTVTVAAAVPSPSRLPRHSPRSLRVVPGCIPTAARRTLRHLPILQPYCGCQQVRPGTSNDISSQHASLLTSLFFLVLSRSPALARRLVAPPLPTFYTLPHSAPSPSPWHLAPQRTYRQGGQHKDDERRMHNNSNSIQQYFSATQSRDLA